MTTPEWTIIELAVRTKRFLDAIDTWLLRQTALIHPRTGALLPALRQRQKLADALARYLKLLGLQRRTPAGVSLHAYLADRYADRSAPDTPGGSA